MTFLFAETGAQLQAAIDKAQTISSFGETLVAAVDAAAAKTTLAITLDDLSNVDTAGATTNGVQYALTYDSTGGGSYDLSTVPAGAGTMGAQDANSVTITGGNATLTGGAFTNLTATNATISGGSGTFGSVNATTVTISGGNATLTGGTVTNLNATTVTLSGGNCTLAGGVFTGTLTAKAPTVAVSGTTKNLALTDGNTIQECSNGSTQTITILANATVAFPTGTWITFEQHGAGQVVVDGDTGVTVNGTSGGNVSIAEQWGACTIRKIATDSWIAYGGLA